MLSFSLAFCIFFLNGTVRESVWHSLEKFPLLDNIFLNVHIKSRLEIGSQYDHVIRPDEKLDRFCETGVPGF